MDENKIASSPRAIYAKAGIVWDSSRDRDGMVPRGSGFKRFDEPDFEGSQRRGDENRDKQ